MPVAPSFKDFIRLTEPFYENGKNYIRVRNPKTGTERKVRWYSDSEYAKAYGKTEATLGSGFRNLKEARGFSKGPILVIRGNKPSDESYLEQSIARYAVGIGWHFVSTDSIPDRRPPHFKYLLLGWKEASIDETHMKEPKELAAILDRKAKANNWVVI